MDKLSFRIYSTLSSSLGRDISIHNSKDLIQEKYGKATYKNIYNKIQGLSKEKILRLERVGRSSIARLNFENSLLTDILSETEFLKKREFLEKNPGLQRLFSDIEFHASTRFPLLESISIIGAEENAKLNRLELLFLLMEPQKGERIESEIEGIYSVMQMLQERHNTRIDCLVLLEGEFFGLLGSKEKNPAKEMLSDKTAFYSPQQFWLSISRAHCKGIQIRTEKHGASPGKISEKDLYYNLNRFGYIEFGEKAGIGENFCIESTITAILLKGDARRKEAIPVILSKELERNRRKPNYRLLIFLCQKYGKLAELLGILKALNRIKKSDEKENAIEIIKRFKIKEKKADYKSIKEKMRLYNAL